LPEKDLEKEITEDFEERQNLSTEGRNKLAERIEENTDRSPALSAGDVDASWDLANESGEETFTGHAPTPDQDIVDLMGKAAGLTYRDDEPLQFNKVKARDERRWEMDPRSKTEAEQMLETTDDDDEEDDDADDEPLRFWDLADDLDEEVEEEYHDVEDEDEDEDDEDEDDDEADVKVVDKLDGADSDAAAADEEEDEALESEAEDEADFDDDEDVDDDEEEDDDDDDDDDDDED
jgi:hypothetical protein